MYWIKRVKKVLLFGLILSSVQSESLYLNDANFSTLLLDAELKQWHQESSIVDYDISDWSARSRKGEEVNVQYIVNDGVGIIVSEKDARGDIVSIPLDLPSFNWFKVKLNWERISGNATVTASLNPVGSIRQIDIEILPAPDNEGYSEVRIHTGRSKEKYELRISVIGEGEVKFNNVSLNSDKPYKVPGGNVLVLDLLSLKPSKDNIHLWENIKNLYYVFGFDTIEIVHPLKIKKSTMEQFDPDLLVLSPTALALDTKIPGIFWKKRHKRGVGRFVEFAEKNNLPLFGICAGHQELASNYGAFLARVKDDTTGQYLYEFGPTDLEVLVDDPIFDNLPNYPGFRIMEAHTIVVHSSFEMATNLATSKNGPTQIYKYKINSGEKSLSWYSFQGHIEKDWYRSCPEGSVIFKNMLYQWGFISD